MISGHYLNMIFGDKQLVIINFDLFLIVFKISPLSFVFKNFFFKKIYVNFISNCYFLEKPDSHKSYRPLTIITFRLNHLFGEFSILIFCFIFVLFFLQKKSNINRSLGLSCYK